MSRESATIPRLLVASTGEPKWTSPAQAASLLATDAEAVYVITDDGRIRAIGRSDAKVRWTVEVDADLGVKAASRGLAAQRRLVITAVHSSVVALDTADGRQVWQHRQLTVSGRAQADQSDGTLCVTGKQLSAFDLVSGKKLWSTDRPKLPHGNPAFWSSPTVDGPILYATEVIFPVQINIRTGKTTGWIYTSLLDCDAGSPLVPQGSALWSVASDEKQASATAKALWRRRPLREGRARAGRRSTAAVSGEMEESFWHM
ncbi:PQQ-binding-like beta-propeller repeat protein [Streptomyces sp. TRM75563]|uniref:outer membrane protein assembly factor BamB family protein n=1 Tax=Streptomyces sp. TRM75563 TaxID=2817418 RepID=UPI001F612E85|nr:PQQ-binding-like beta-propeller repeat protein [Streptomyces sp. TRM75563]MCI4040504.1 PQQ-like beta-propeller repeat protein [Streptomyces sp. TRM75563]